MCAMQFGALHDRQSTCPSGQRLLPTRIVHSLDDSWPRVRCIVDLSFAKVITCNEEGSFDVVLVENIEHIVGVYIRTIIEGEGDHSIDGTVEDTITAVCDRAKFCARHSRCIGTRWGCIGITCGTIVELAVRCCAIRIALPTPALYHVS